MMGTQAIHAQDEIPMQLTKSAIAEDIAFLDEALKTQSSYQGLNGFDYQTTFQEYLASIHTETVAQHDFGLFLRETIGKIGDRHAYVKGFKLPNSLFLPFVVAPLDGQVVGVHYVREERKYELLHPNFPYLKAINGTPVQAFLKAILPEDSQAPSEAYHAYAVKRLKYMEKNYATLQLPLPAIFEFTFTNHTSDTIVRLPLERERRKYRTWDERFQAYFGQEKEELNDAALCEKFFQIDENNVAYARWSDMVKPKDAPVFYEAFRDFMQAAISSKALIIDIRNNGGGTRHLIFELAKYLVHPEAIHVVNIAQQRTKLPLDEDYKVSLNHRFLYALSDLDTREQASVKALMKGFQPMYNLPSDKFSEPYFCVFNGEKLSKLEGVYHYDKPVYILMNERCFSAASILVATFKDLPNVQLVGVQTDGSSGNSRYVELPKSKLLLKLSTMVSFQKDGRILDGYGTMPDIEIKRNLAQVLWQEDYQLEQLKRLITSSCTKER